MRRQGRQNQWCREIGVSDVCSGRNVYVIESKYSIIRANSRFFEACDFRSEGFLNLVYTSPDVVFDLPSIGRFRKILRVEIRP